MPENKEGNTGLKVYKLIKIDTFVLHSYSIFLDCSLIWSKPPPNPKSLAVFSYAQTGIQTQAMVRERCLLVSSLCKVNELRIKLTCKVMRVYNKDIIE